MSHTTSTSGFCLVKTQKILIHTKGAVFSEIDCRRRFPELGKYTAMVLAVVRRSVPLETIFNVLDIDWPW